MKNTLTFPLYAHPSLIIMLSHFLAYQSQLLPLQEVGESSSPFPAKMPSWDGGFVDDLGKWPRSPAP